MPRHMRAAAPVLSLILLVWPSHGAEIILRPDRHLAQAVQLADAYPTTVRVGSASGTLVGRTWVLTAAHVAQELSALEPEVVIGGRTRRVARVLVHPEGQSDGRRPPRVDLALLELDAPVTDVLPSKLYTGLDESDRDVVLAGFGDFGLAGRPLQRWDGRARAATNTIDRATDRHLVISLSEPPAGTELEGVGGPGDSGGPLFIDVDGKPHVAGVSSASMGRPGQFGASDMYVRVSQFRRWIERTMRDPGEAPLLPEAVDAEADGLPETDAGRMVGAFLDAFNAGSPQELAEFGAAYRLAGARRDRSDADWAALIWGWREQFGRWSATRYVEGPRGPEVLVRTEQEERCFLRFLIQVRDGEPKLDGIGLDPRGPKP